MSVRSWKVAPKTVRGLPTVINVTSSNFKQIS